MKIVINVLNEGITVPKELIERLTKKEYYVDGWFVPYDRNLRTDDILVKWVEEHSDADGYADVDDYCMLYIIDIPDEATDWMLNEYFCGETITYVVDGMLHTARDSTLGQRHELVNDILEEVEVKEDAKSNGEG